MASWPETTRLIGTRIQRIDGPDKATGRAKYSFDINRPRMLHARILRSDGSYTRAEAGDGPTHRSQTELLALAASRAAEAEELDQDQQAFDPFSSVGATNGETSRERAKRKKKKSSAVK